jgi:hypothetical protein
LYKSLVVGKDVDQDIVDCLVECTERNPQSFSSTRMFYYHLDRIECEEDDIRTSSFVALLDAMPAIIQLETQSFLLCAYLETHKLPQSLRLVTLDLIEHFGSAHDVHAIEVFQGLAAVSGLHELYLFCNALSSSEAELPYYNGPTVLPSLTKLGFISRGSDGPEPLSSLGALFATSRIQLPSLQAVYFDMDHSAFEGLFLHLPPAPGLVFTGSPPPNLGVELSLHTKWIEIHGEIPPYCRLRYGEEDDWYDDARRGLFAFLQRTATLSAARTLEYIWLRDRGSWRTMEALGTLEWTVCMLEMGDMAQKILDSKGRNRAGTRVARSSGPYFS